MSGWFGWFSCMGDTRDGGSRVASSQLLQCGPLITMSDAKNYCIGGTLCCTGLCLLITLITIFASMYNLGPEDQVLTETSEGKEVTNGPYFGVMHPFRKHEQRKAIRLLQMEYARVKNTRSGITRHESGPMLLFLEGWDDLEGVRLKIVLQMHQYSRLIDDLTGFERVVTGPTVLVPEPFETAPNGTENAVVISPETSVVVLNKTLGVLTSFTEPGVFYPGPYEEITGVIQATVVGPTEYAVMRHTKTGVVRHIVGPAQVKVEDPYEVIEEVAPKILLKRDQYIRLVNQLTGFERVVVGPDTVVPDPGEVSEDGVQNSARVTVDTTVLAINTTTGLRRLVTEKGLFAPGPYEVIPEGGVRTATLLGELQYAVVENDRTGARVHEAGPQLLKVDAYDRVIQVRDKIVLEKDEYIRLVDQMTGVERVLQGPRLVVPQPTEQYPEGVVRANYLDSNLAVLLEDQTNGIQTLNTTEGPFVPVPYTQVIEERPLVRVMPHQGVIVRDAAGMMTFHEGGENAIGEGTSFFLYPYTHIVVMMWSSYDGSHAPGTKVPVDFIDRRSRRMFYRYEGRTKDNVELILDGTVFWQVSDIEKMVNATADPEGDTWQKARAKLVSELAKVTLEQFMDNLTHVTVNAFQSAQGDSFFEERGIVLTEIEITSYDFTDPETQEIVHEIIVETTERMNRQAQQETQIELAHNELLAEIDLEAQRTTLINQSGTNACINATTHGTANGLRVSEAAVTFLDGLETSVADVTQRVDLYKHREELSKRNKDTTSLASTGNVKLFMKPEDLNLK